jgi:type III restriction enzyme
VSPSDTSGTSNGPRKVNRRPAFATTEIYLPKVMRVEGGSVRDLDYETDVLAAIDWRGFDPRDVAARIPENAQAAESQLQRIKLSDSGKEVIVGETVAANIEVLVCDGQDDL